MTRGTRLQEPNEGGAKSSRLSVRPLGRQPRKTRRRGEDRGTEAQPKGVMAEGKSFCPRSGKGGPGVGGETRKKKISRRFHQNGHERLLPSIGETSLKKRNSTERSYPFFYLGGRGAPLRSHGKLAKKGFMARGYLGHGMPSTICYWGEGVHWGSGGGRGTLIQKSGLRHLCKEVQILSKVMGNGDNCRWKKVGSPVWLGMDRR